MSSLRGGDGAGGALDLVIVDGVECKSCTTLSTHPSDLVRLRSRTTLMELTLTAMPLWKDSTDSNPSLSRPN